MNFDLSEEQSLLKDSVDKLLDKTYGFERRREHAREPGGWSRAVWDQFAELGLLALPFDPDDGGLGMGPVELMLVMEGLGRTLVLEPYVSTVVEAGTAIRLAGSAEQRADWIARIAGGETTLAIAHAERQARYALEDVATTAVRVAGGYRLDGAKILVSHGDSVDAFVVSARTAGARTDEEGIGLFLVPADTDGLTRRGYALHDGTRAADVTLTGVVVPETARLGADGQGLATLRRVADHAIAAQAAEAVGAMQAALDMTVEYLGQRRQFGVAIGSFQALQHRAAEMLIALEQARSMAMFAALMVEDPDPLVRGRALSAVKVQIGASGRFIGQQAIQLHGGIGITEEYAVGHYFRRLSLMESRHGDSSHHLARVAAVGGFIAADIA